MDDRAERFRPVGPIVKANGPGRTVWLASYPKSGNTWVRAIVTALGTHPHLFGVNQLTAGAQPFHVSMALGSYGLDPRWLNRHETDRLRTALALSISSADRSGSDEGAPVLRKTHERYRRDPKDAEPFPRGATRAAILVVRDPRDVACSYAPFFGMTIDEAINAMSTEIDGRGADPAHAQTAQPWGSWSSMHESWVSADVPFPVHVVHYEELHADAVASLLPVFHAIGLRCSRESLAAAVDLARFGRLQDSENERGFRGTTTKTTQFFRSGTGGGWRSQLTAAQVAAIEADHTDAMTRLGYELSTPADVREPLRQARDSLRRQRIHRGPHLPPSLEMTVRTGRVPETLDGASTPRPWIQVTPTSALLTFPSGARLLVSNGTDVTLDLPDEFAAGQDDFGAAGWIVQGWAVTLAMLQRGHLSLHAATVQVGAQVFALAGNRGAGKSTTAMGLRARGHQLLCDDVTLVEFRQDSAWTTPYSRNVHLLEDAAGAVGVDFASLPPLGGGRRKAAFRPEDPVEEPHRIDRIIVLAPDDVDSVTTTRPRGTARMTALLDHTRRDGIAPILLGQERYFAQVTRLADIVPITVLARPRGAWTLDAVLDLIESGA